MNIELENALRRMKTPRLNDPQEGRERDEAAMRLIESAVLEGDHVNRLVNSPEIEDFITGVRLEAVHQVIKWGEAHDRSKSGENWFWLVGYLAGKCLRAVITGDRTKSLHHAISTAAACANWHAAILRDQTGSGIGEDADIAPIEVRRFEGVDIDRVHRRPSVAEYTHVSPPVHHVDPAAHDSLWFGASGHASGIRLD